MAGYRLNRTGMISDLTMAQQMFVALVQEKTIEIQLSPWLDRTPSPEVVSIEDARLRNFRTKFKDMDLTPFTKPIPESWDPRTPLT